MPKELTPFRKKQLQKQILEARSLGSIDHILFLESQWVHRYGIETLEDCYAQELELSTSISLDKIEAGGHFEESEITGQKNLFSDHLDLEDDLTLKTSDHSKQLKLDDDVVELSLEKKLDVISDQEIELSKSVSNILPVIASPPPTPALNHLRRWLPAIDDSIPKAS